MLAFFFVFFLLPPYLLFLIEDVIFLSETVDDDQVLAPLIWLLVLSKTRWCVSRQVWAECVRYGWAVAQSPFIVQISLICYESVQRFSLLYERYW